MQIEAKDIQVGDIYWATPEIGWKVDEIIKVTAKTISYRSTCTVGVPGRVAQGDLRKNQHRLNTVITVTRPA